MEYVKIHFHLSIKHLGWQQRLKICPSLGSQVVDFFSPLEICALAPAPARWEGERWKNGRRRESSLMGSEWILDDVIYSQRSSTVALSDLDPLQSKPHSGLASLEI